MNIRSSVFWLTVFAAAFGIVEGSVVVYLRKIYYPDEVALFPLKSFEPSIYLVELVREAATLFMLFAVPAAIFRKSMLRFAGFIWGFAVWDIVYYILLKASLGWPLHFFEWDVLFLIPVVWASPMVAPIICSATMMFLAGIIFFYSAKNYSVKFSRLQLWLLIAGSLLILVSFMQDYTMLAFSTASEKLQEAAAQFIPGDFNWVLFFIGEAVILFAIWDLMKKTGRTKNHSSLPLNPST
jgi:hypothetical protein